MSVMEVDNDSRTSLERLKNLDSLRLDEAKRLCNHRARAEMVAKWLFGKLKDNQEVRSSSEAWALLLHSLRLLSPARIASLLAAHNLLGSISITLSEAPASPVLLLEHISLLCFLLDLSNSATGTQVKAALRATPEEAASFLGAWLRHVQRIAASDTSHITLARHQGLLAPAFEIWQLRKSGASSEFAQHCLVPAALLLQSDLYSARPSLKRKSHNENGVRQRSDRDFLETSIAKHIFLEAKSTYLRDEVTNFRHNEEMDEINRPGYRIRSLLKPLEHDQTSVLPQLLDISIRCSTTSTHPAKEYPWIEIVFRALDACNRHEDGNTNDFSVLTRMLHVLRQNLSLSKEAIMELCVIGPAESGFTADRWQAVAEFVAMDPDAFADYNDARDVFTAISRTANELTLRVSTATRDQLELCWRERIIVAIMKAFARKRELCVFINIWSDCMQSSDHSIWRSFSSTFSELVEEALMEQAILDQFNRFSKLLKTAHDAANPLLVILNALLAGISSPSVLQKLQPLLDECLEVLVGFTVASRDDFYWKLLIRVFDMWCPAWIAQQSSSHEVAQKAITLMKSSVVELALTVVRLDTTHSDPPHAPADVTISAGAFIASLCYSFHEYRDGDLAGCHEGCVQVAKELVVSLGTAAIDVLVLYPPVLHLLDSDTRRACLLRSVEAVTAKGVAISRQDSMVEALQSIARSAAHSTPSLLVEEPAELAVETFQSALTGMEDASATKCSIVLKLFNELPARAIARPQRENILNTICEVQCRSEPYDIENQNQRLSLLIKLMEVANPTCRLSTDPAELWRLGRSVVIHENVTLDGHLAGEASTDPSTTLERYGGTKQSETLALLEELASLVMDHLLVTQDQDRSHTMLLAMSTEVKSHVISVGNERKLAGTEWVLPLVKVVVSRLEALSKTELAGQLAYRDPSIFGPFLEVLCEHTVARGVGESNIDGLPVHPPWLIPALETLSAMPQQLVPASLYDSIDTKRQAAMENLIHSLAAQTAATQETSDAPTMIDELYPSQSVLVGCFGAGCKYGSINGGVEYARLAFSIISTHLHPRLFRSLSEAYAEFVGRFDASQKIELIESMLVNAATTSASIMRLVQTCFTTIDESVATGDNLSGLQALFRRLLNAYTGYEDSSLRVASAECITTVLKQKAFLTNQYTIEAVLQAVLGSLRNCGPSAFSSAIDITSMLLLQYRSRLRGRCHLVILVFQLMISAAFARTSKRFSSNDLRKSATVRNGSRVARLLVLFCEPTPWKSKTTSLVDEARKEQAYVGQHVQYVLHHYCRQVLSSTPAAGVRDALKPGLWSVIEAMEMNDATGIKSLSAAMNNSERAVLRGVYEEWRRFGKWRGS